MARQEHPKRAIEEVLKIAESEGWRIEKAGNSSHSWGRLYCPGRSSNCCKPFSIYSTPASAENHARLIQNRINKHKRKVEYDSE